MSSSLLLLRKKKKVEKRFVVREEVGEEAHYGLFSILPQPLLQRTLKCVLLVEVGTILHLRLAESAKEAFLS